MFWPASVSRQCPQTFAFFLHFFCVCFQACIFFAFVLHFGRPRLPGLRFCFAFWSSLGLRCAAFSHFAGSRPLQPKEMQQKCKAQFKQASNTKKMQSKIQAGQQTRKNANSKCKTNATHKKCKQQMQKNAKEMQNIIQNTCPVCGPKILLRLCLPGTLSAQKVLDEA